MKIIWLGCTALALVGSLLAGCGSAESADGTSSDEALSNGPTTSNAAPANTIMKVTPPHVIQKVTPPPTTSTATGDACPVGERTCEFANDKGICVERCVPAGVMCVAPNCVVCDPAGPRPNPGCSWDSENCEWSCPVCDPAGPKPEPGCTWDSKACVWLCL